jgi:hypothetical protein
MEVQAIVQSHVDNAVSKTINMAFDYPVEDMSKMWLEYLPRLKGTTFYRENTRGFVNPDGSIAEPPLKAIDIQEAKQRRSAFLDVSQAVTGLSISYGHGRALRHLFSRSDIVANGLSNSPEYCTQLRTNLRAFGLPAMGIRGAAFSAVSEIGIIGLSVFAKIRSPCQSCLRIVGIFLV